MRTVFLKNLAAAVFAAAIAMPASAERSADLIVVNARVWTADPDNPRASALAVHDGEFVHVGGDAAARDLAEESTRIIDAEGRRVLPGLIDTHVHLQSAAASLGRLDLRPAESREQFLSMLRDYARDLGPDEWVLGRGWSAESWPDPRPPTAEEIDQAVNGRPAVLTRMDGHSLIAGATALEIAGIDQDGPPDPPGGRIGRFDDGRPSGALYDEAMGLVTKHAPSESPKRVRRLLHRALDRAVSFGLTQVGAIDSRAFVEDHLVPLDEAGDLPLRVAATISEEKNTVDAWRPVLHWASANPQPSGRVRVIGFKGYMDGSLGSRTAWMFEPYMDNPRDEDNAGFPLALAESGALAELIRLGASMGLQPAVHAIGDRANHVLLGWYEELPAWRRRVIRPRIEHAQHLTAEDIPRFGELGVIPSMQPLHKADDGRYAEQRLGPERIQTSYTFRSLLETGADLAFGSDWPVVSADPFLGIHAAVTAKTRAGETFVPDQSITVQQALRCYTSRAAFCLRNEHRTGAIKPGRAADFVLLDHDPFRIDPADLKDVGVMLTVVGGETVHRAE